MSDWRIFKGDEQAVPAQTTFPPPPPWRVPGERRERVLAATFRPSAELVEAVNAAIYLRRPLLITGKPGSGKSSLIHAAARELMLGKVLTWAINSRSTLRDALYTYDALGRLQAIQELQASGARAESASDASDLASFITLGPLGTALASRPGPRALLVDEIDKSDVDLPNDLLNVLDTGRFPIPELRRRGGPAAIADSEGGRVTVPAGEITFSEFPFVIMTSNGERDFPGPFLRRCVQFELPEPNEAELRRIVLAHFPNVDAAGPDLTGDKGLLARFVAKRKELPLSTDQLLNAVHVLRNAGQTFTLAEEEALLGTLFQKLG